MLSLCCHELLKLNDVTSTYCLPGRARYGGHTGVHCYSLTEAQHHTTAPNLLDIEINDHDTDFFAHLAEYLFRDKPLTNLFDARPSRAPHAQLPVFSPLHALRVQSQHDGLHPLLAVQDQRHRFD